MKTTTFSKRRGYLVIGTIGLLVSGVYLGLTLQLPFGQRDQPGAAVFPLMTAVLLILGSIATLSEGWRLPRAAQVVFPAGADLKRLLSLMGSLLGYFLLLPWLGQIISSFLFSLLLMRVLSPFRWGRIVFYSFVMSIALYGAFVFLLKVPMPKGVFVF